MPRYATIEDVIASYPDRFDTDKADGVDATVFMDLSGANAKQVLLRVNGPELTIEENAAVPEDPTLTLKADADDWLAIENGQTNPMMALLSGKLKLKGSVPFATKFMTLFGG